MLRAFLAIRFAFPGMVVELMAAAFASLISSTRTCGHIALDKKLLVQCLVIGLRGRVLAIRPTA
jgi:hypothetical protein